MNIIFFLILFLVAENEISGSFLNPYPRFETYIDNEDPGDPLYLTPLINKGKINEARQKAKVTGEGGNGLDSIESYSGYLTVDKTKEYESNMFFWYFPAKSNENYAPIILWLQGGPGASSLFGLFAENGPFEISKNGTFSQREYTWNQNHHLIYIDNPVGTGYSFTTSEQGYAKNEVEVGRNLYEALVQLFTLFPEFQKLDFWATGESYGGKYVPAVAYKIHKTQNSKQKPQVFINLKGLAIGNGLSDPLHQLKYSDYLYQIGLIDLNGKKMVQDYEKRGTDCIKHHNMSCAFHIFDELIDGDQFESGSLFKNLTGYEMYYNYLKTKEDSSDGDLGKFLQMSSTRRSIHVGNNTFHDLSGTENLVEKFLENDIMDTVAPWVAELLNSDYRICIYNGQLDIIVAYPLTLSYLQKLKFKDANIYKTAPRYIWKVKDKNGNPEVAGYAKEAGHLVEVLVRNAGHMVPADQPRWALDMITRLTYGKGFK